MVGTPLLRHIASQAERVLATDLRPSHFTPPNSNVEVRQLDVARFDELEQTIAGFEPTLIINLAAETSLETCESSPTPALATNLAAAIKIAELCAAGGIDLVHFSSAGVFDGLLPRMYTEDDYPIAISVYGWTKAASERAVAAIHPEALILRPGWMFGGGRGVDHKFVGAILAQVEAGNTVVRAVTDKLGVPTYSPDLARQVCELVRIGAFGLYHAVSGSHAVSRFDVAEHLIAILGLPVAVEPATSAEFARTFPVPRPPSEALACEKLRASGAHVMRQWEDCLAEYVADEWARA